MRASTAPLPSACARQRWPPPWRTSDARLPRSLPLLADQRSMLRAGVIWVWGRVIGERSPWVSLSRGGSDRGEPAGVALVAAAHGGEVATLDVERGREVAGPDRTVVDRRDRGDLDAGAGQEDLVGQIELGAVDPPLHHLQARIGGDAQDRGARDAGQDVIGQWRRGDFAAAD